MAETTNKLPQSLVAAITAKAPALKTPPRYFFSATTLGFYRDTLHKGRMPADAKEITEDQWRGLIQAHSEGCEIKAAADGMPIAVKRAATLEQRAAWKRAERDAALKATDWLLTRHIAEGIMRRPTTLQPVQFALLLQHQQALRELPAHPQFPDIELPKREGV